MMMTLPMKELKDTAKQPLLETRTPTLALEPDEVLIRVCGASISRVDLVPHEKDEKVLIRECSGHIIKVGRSVTRWRIGDKVCALLNVRGYADEVVVSSECVLRAPSFPRLVRAAGLPMVACITYYAVNKCLHELNKGDILVIPEVHFHFTLFALGSAKRRGLRVFVVTESVSPRGIYRQMGADALIYARKENIVEQVRKLSGMKGANAILSYGAPRITEYSQCLAKNGVFLLVCDKHQKSEVEAISLGHLISSCARVNVWNIEYFPASLDKTSLELLVREVENYIWPDIENGLQLHVCYETVPASEVTVLEVMEKLGTEKIILAGKELSLASYPRFQGL